MDTASTRRHTEFGLLASCGAVAVGFALVLLAFFVTIDRRHQADDVAGAQPEPVEQTCVRC